MKYRYFFVPLVLIILFSTSRLLVGEHKNLSPLLIEKEVVYPIRKSAKTTEPSKEYENPKWAILHKVRASVLEIQIEADKGHNVFISEDDTREKYKATIKEFILSKAEDGFPLLDDFLHNEIDENEAVIWSNALALYRFATTPEEKLELLNSLIQEVFERGDFQQTNDLIDCKTGRILYDEFNGARLHIVFHSAGDIKNSDHDLVQSQKDADEAEKKLSKKNVRGVLYAWSVEKWELQSCGL